MKPNRLLMLVLLVAVIPGSVDAALSLGSVQIDRTASAFPGEDVYFKVLLFNVHGDKDIRVMFYSEHPQGWVVNVPESVEVKRSVSRWNNAASDGYELISGRDGYIQAKPVTIRVGVPYSAASGRYNVTVYARISGKGNGTLSVSQIRSFHFNVVVGKPDADAAENSGEGKVRTNADRGNGKIEVVDKENPRRPDNGKGNNESNDSSGDVKEGVDYISGAASAGQVSIPVMVLAVLVTLLIALKVSGKI